MVLGAELTIETESRAETAKISAHETTPGHAFSTADLMLSTTSNPLAEFRLGTAPFSPLIEEVSSRRIDPSHPCLGKISEMNKETKTTSFIGSIDDDCHTFTIFLKSDIFCYRKFKLLLILKIL